MTDQDKPGVDWNAKHAAAGQNAQAAEDRPHRIDPPTHPVRDDDVITSTRSDDVITVHTGKIVNR